MRIVGGKDYYDHGLAYGVDQELVFVRTGTRFYTELHRLVLPSNWGRGPGLDFAPAAVTERSRWPYTDGSRWWHNGTSYYAEGVVVVFCGRYYGGVRVHSYPEPGDTRHPPQVLDWPGNGLRWATDTFWDQNTLGRHLAKCGARVRTHAKRSLLLRDHSGGPEQKPFYRGAVPPAMLQRQVELGVAVATLSALNTENVQLPGWNHRHNHSYWDVNSDTLKHFDFVKVMDPVKAFQELSMWVGGVLPRAGAPMVEITDDRVKAHKAGFDRYSFKKLPTKVR